MTPPILSLIASAVAAFGHLVFAIAARRAGGAVPRAFSNVALILSLWSASHFAGDLLPDQVGFEVPWIVALALPPVALELAARVHGSAPRLARAARFSWLPCALAAFLLALRVPYALQIAAALLFPALLLALGSLHSAFRRRRQSANAFLLGAAVTIVAGAVDASPLLGLPLPSGMPRLAALGSVVLVAQLGSSVARHGLFELKPVFGRVATLAVVALIVALVGVAALDHVHSPVARILLGWSLVLGFALIEQPLLRRLRSPGARAAARRRRALVERLSGVHRVLAHVNHVDELGAALARHLTAGGEIRAVEFTRGERPPAPPGHAAVRLLRLRSLGRTEGFLRIAFADGALPRHRRVRRALRGCADRVAAYAGALRLVDEKRLAQRLAELGAVAAEVAHEVKNPLGAIVGALDLVDGATPEEARRWWGIVRDEARRLDRVVSDALALGRATAARLAPTSPVRLVEDLLSLAKGRAGAVALSARVPADAAPVALDPDLIRQALLNLVLNGIAAQPAGGRVDVAFEAADATVRFHVRDDGPGVPVELRPRVFEPFFTTRAAGSGLGLAVAHKAAVAHGGRLELLEPDDGFRGAHFVLKLPRGPVPAGSTTDGA